ncbi:MAG: penicillin-binding protein, partial [Chloroflexi bacterium]|nr:penicillin-binding protein [Chloroflexota bacterium]
MHPALQRRRRHLMMTRRTTRRGSRTRGVATLLLVTVGVFGLMFVGSVMGTAGGMFAAYNYFASDLPEPNILDGIEPPESTYVYDRSGEVLLARFECQNREAVEFTELPDTIWQATVASEDRTFWENNGVDFQGTVRAALANLKAGSIVQGASTITQQVIDYARVLQEEGESTQVDADATPAPSAGEIDPDAPATEDQDDLEEASDVCQPPEPNQSTEIEDKIRENILAMNVTAEYPGRAGKEQILETYLNLIYYGNGSYGIKAAAANYFGLTDLQQMTIAQAAFLAALPQRPSVLDPYQNPNGAPGSEEAAATAIRERNLVIGAMAEEGYITATEAREARNTSWLDMNPNRLTSILREPHFSFRVQREAERILGSLGVEDPEAAVRIGGYRITTTLDYDLQQVAHELVEKWVASLEDKNVNNSAMVAIDSATGEIVAYIGSVDYYNREDPKVQGQFDVAGLGLRQPGSAFKPITYASAFKARDATVATMFVDGMTEFGLTEETSYRPTNADIKEHGPVLATDALRYSLNIPSVMMQYLVGSLTTAEFSESLGIASANYIMGLDPGVTLALGSIPLNLTNMTQAYTSFAQEGAVNPATTIIEIRNRDGRVIYTREDDGPEQLNPMTPAEAYLPHWILEGNTDPDRNALWGERAQLNTPDGERRPAGFKTGTTDNFRDVSGFGYVPGSLVTGVWMGNNNQESLSNVLGQGLFSADGPLFLWEEFMRRALNEPWDWNGQEPVGQTSFDQPNGIVTAEICRWSGLAATNQCGETMEMPFLEGTVPATDNVHPRGCLDLELYLEKATPERPENWVEAAETWANRVVNRETGARGDPADHPDEDVRFAISPIYGESAFPSICGERRAPPRTPRPSASPEPSPSAGDDEDEGGGRGGGPGPTPTP